MARFGASATSSGAILSNGARLGGFLALEAKLRDHSRRRHGHQSMARCHWQTSRRRLPGADNRVCLPLVHCSASIRSGRRNFHVPRVHPTMRVDGHRTHCGHAGCGAFARRFRCSADPVAAAGLAVLYDVVPSFQQKSEISQFRKIRRLFVCTYLYAFPIQQMLAVLMRGRAAFAPFVICSMLSSLFAGVLSWHLVERWFAGKRGTAAPRGNPTWHQNRLAVLRKL